MDKIKATFLLHALGDTIGFKNGEWEFNYFNKNADYRTTLEIVFDFISLGGITGIDLKEWTVSDDTLFHIAVAKSLIEIDFKDKLTEKNIEKVKNIMLDALDKIADDENKDKKFRGVGATTYNSLVDNKVSLITSGGNGVAMRSLCIGLAYHNINDINNINKLIEYSIETGRITHKNPIGFLGGLSTAYFTYLALNNIPIEEWPFKLIELVESPEVLKYIDKDNFIIFSDYRLFISLWKKYIDLRFKNNKPIYTKSHKNLIFRTKFFYDFKYNYDKFEEKEITKIYDMIGGSGVTGTLMAYDALLDSGDNWEKLIYYSMLHVGDSDTVGAIAGGLYGAMYGIDKVPENLLRDLEKKKELIDISEKIYKKFYS